MSDPPPPDPQTSVEAKENEEQQHPVEPTNLSQTDSKEEQQQVVKNTPSPPKSPSEEDGNSFHSAEEDDTTMNVQQNEQDTKKKEESSSDMKELNQEGKAIGEDKSDVIFDVTDSNAILEPGQNPIANINKKVEALTINKNESVDESKVGDETKFEENPPDVNNKHSKMEEDRQEQEQKLATKNGEKQNEIDDDEKEDKPRKKRIDEEGADEQNSGEEEGNDEYETEDDEEKKSVLKEQLDDDEIKDSPAYIPKQGRFYMHDDARSVPSAGQKMFSYNEDDEQIVEEEDADDEDANDEKKKNEVKAEIEKQVQQQGIPKTRADRMDCWSRDLYNEEDQAPKSRDYLIKRYGRNILKNEQEEEETEQNSQTRGGRQRGGRGRGSGPQSGLGQNRRQQRQNSDERTPPPPPTRNNIHVTQRKSTNPSGRAYGLNGRVVVKQQQQRPPASTNQQRNYQSNAKAPQRQGRFQQHERNSDNKWDTSIENATSGGWDNKNENNGGWKNDNQGRVWDGIEISNSPIRRTNPSNSRSRNEVTRNYRNVQPPQNYGNEDEKHRRGPTPPLFSRNGGRDGIGGYSGNRGPPSHSQRNFNQQQRSSGGRPSASDFFDDRQQRIGAETGRIKFGHPHRTTQAPPEREGRFAAQSAENMENISGMGRGSNFAEGRRGRGGEYSPQVQREGRLSSNSTQPQHQQLMRDAGNGGRGGSGFGGGSRRGGGIRFGGESQHDGGGNLGSYQQGQMHRSPQSSVGGGNQGGDGGGNRDHGPVAQQQNDYPYPRQPTDPVYFNIDHQRSGHPPPQRMRRQLPIAPPH